jgi:hypothetical protein
MSEFHAKRLCGGTTLTGQPCKQWAATGTRDFRCIRHTEDPNRTGGGISVQGRQPICYCDAYADETGKPKKHKAGAGLCQEQVTVSRIHGDPPPVPGPGMLPEPASTDLAFEGMDGQWLTYLQLIATGGRLKQAAAAAGLTVAEVNKRKKTDPGFVEQYELAERLALDAVEDAMYGLATGRYGLPNMEAIKLILGNRAPERWKADLRNLKVEGVVEHQHDVAGSLGRIAELEQKLLDRAKYGNRPIQARVLDATAEEPPVTAERALGTPWDKATPEELGHLR